MKEQITLIKIYNNSSEINNKFNKTLYRNIIYDYMRLIFKSTLEGNKINLLGGLGKVYISVGKRSFNKGKKVDWGNSEYKIINGVKKYTKLKFHHDDFPIFFWKKGYFTNMKKFRFRLTKGYNNCTSNNSYILKKSFEDNPEIFYRNIFLDIKIGKIKVYNEHGAYLYTTTRSKLPDKWSTVKKYIDFDTKEGSYKNYKYKILPL